MIREKQWRQTEHAILPRVRPGQAEDYAGRMGLSVEDGWVKLIELREQAIRNEREAPYEFGWEPPIWNVIRALVGWRLRETRDAQRALGRLQEENAKATMFDLAARIREACGFERAVTSLLILGGNRGGKTTVGTRICMEVLREIEKGIGWLFHSTVEQSVAYHHALMWDWMPQELRGKDIRSRSTYVSYKAKVGFSEAGFVLPNLARCTFKTYEMDRDKAVEGGKPDFVYCDELVPCDWVETLEYRTAERGGRLLVGFTPVHGYSETVGMFMDGATVTRWKDAYLLPKDGGEPDVARELGLTADAGEAYGKWLDESMRGEGPDRRCVPEDCYQWLVNSEQCTVNSGRKFDRVPRVARGAKVERGVVFIHSTDNPFGNPLAVWRRCAEMNGEKIKERFYGWATRQYGVLFGKFSRKVHVIPAEKVPKDGTMYCVIDPAGNRNWFAVWILARKDGWYVVEEFPNQVTDVPGVGVMGPWAEPDGKLRDGRRGDGQVSLGWSLMQYKEWFARVEGWRDCGTRKEDREKETFNAQRSTFNAQQKTENGEQTGVEKWREENGSEWAVFERMMDSRFGGAVQQGVQGVTTLIEECCRIGLTVVPATVDVAADGRHAVSEGYQFIQDALAWDDGRPMDGENRPKLWVSERCRNVIYALETHTGTDGQKGATKDVIDVIRMGFLKGMPYVAPGWRLRCVGGGHY